MNLLEQYKNRLAVSEKMYARTHMNEGMSNYKKLTIARCLENTNRFLNEAFASADATQRSALGDFKRFCLNLTTVALPNLIAPELVLVQPMSSLTGYITYLEYTAGPAKGGVEAGQFFNGVFNMGEMTESRMHYTGQAVVEAVENFQSGTTKVAWTPVVEGKIRFLDADGNELEASDVEVAADGTVTATVTGTVAKLAYVYDNVIIPQDKLPTLVANLNTITLTAHARRIAVYYSQIAAFQAKTDYGFDLGDQIAEQAVGELQYEIDSEVVAMLNKGAEANEALNWSRTLPVGVSKRDHYQGFAEIIEIGKSIVYKRTQKFAPNYMVIASDILPVITFIQGWNAAPAGAINGPYFAGTLNGIKVFVSPMLADGEYFMGVLGNDLQTAAGVYAPYMPVVPTQLLGFADGTMSQGFSTMYDMKLLSTYVKDGNTYSRLLVKGQVSGNPNERDFPSF